MELWIIDDDPIIKFATKHILKGFEEISNCEEFDDGSLALSEINTRIERKSPFPQIILLDINMPELNGWELLDELLQINFDFEKVKVYMYSSSSNSSDKIKSQGYPVVDYIIKPLSKEKFREILDSL